MSCLPLHPLDNGPKQRLSTFAARAAGTCRGATAGRASSVFRGTFWTHGRINVAGISRFRGEWFDIQGFANSELRTLSRSVTPWIFHKNLISAACAWDNILSVITQEPWAQGEDRNKDRFKNWQLYRVWKLPICRVSFTNPCTSLAVPPSIPRMYHPRYWNLSTC